MRILLIAPDQPDINNIPEIRALSDTHQTTVLNGRVSNQDIYNYIGRSAYDVVHFATHQAATEDAFDKILLSNGELLDLAAVTHIAKLSNARLIFFNLCNASRFAAYLVRHGVPACIYTTLALKDSNAWQTPWHFYEEARRQEKVNPHVELRRIFDQVDPGDGIYGWNSGMDYYLSTIEDIQSTLARLIESDTQITNQIKDIVAFQQQLVLNQTKFSLTEQQDRMLEYGLVLILALGILSFVIPFVLSLFK